MSQRKSATRQSDLQPVYDLIDMLRPTHIRAAYHQLNHRTRAILMISVASIVLIWALSSIFQLAFDHIKATTGPFLVDALKAPYDLDLRSNPMPPTNQSGILPNDVGDYSLAGNIYQATPMPVATTANKPNTAAAEPTTIPQVPTSAVDAQLSLCLSTAVDNASAANCTGFSALYTSMGDYHDASGATINIAMALFTSHKEAGDVMRKLQQQAAQIGHIGNYAIGVTQVDYFYSSQSKAYVFSWASGSWVYTAASASFADLEKFVTAFPY